MKKLFDNVPIDKNISSYFVSDSRNCSEMKTFLVYNTVLSKIDKS